MLVKIHISKVPQASPPLPNQARVMPLILSGISYLTRLQRYTCLWQENAWNCGTTGSELQRFVHFLVKVISVSLCLSLSLSVFLSVCLSVCLIRNHRKYCLIPSIIFSVVGDTSSRFVATMPIVHAIHFRSSNLAPSVDLF